MSSPQEKEVKGGWATETKGVLLQNTNTWETLEPILGNLGKTGEAGRLTSLEGGVGQACLSMQWGVGGRGGVVQTRSSRW